MDTGLLLAPTPPGAGIELKVRIIEQLSWDIAAGAGFKVVFRGRVEPCQPGQEQKDKKKVLGLVGGKVKVPAYLPMPGGSSVVLMHPQEDKDQDELKREAKILQMLSHKNIIKLIAFEDSLTVDKISGKEINMFLVTEAVRPLGYDLFTHTENFKHVKRAVPEHDVDLIVSQLISVLRYIHAQSVIHRDLKPDNVLLNSKFELKLIDFGMASWTQYHPGKESKASYAAPEVNVIPHDQCIDLWGVGVLIWSLYGNYTKVATIKNPAQDFNKFLENQKKQVPDRVVEVLNGLLTKTNRWDLDQVQKWKNAQPRQESGLAPLILSRWTRPAPPIFLARLPGQFKERPLYNKAKEDVLVKGDVATVLMVDSGNTINMIPEGDTILKGGDGVYFALRDVNIDEPKIEGFLNKMNLEDVIQRARDTSSPALIAGLEAVCREREMKFSSFNPQCDVFEFPDHCVGAVLGESKGKNSLNLRNKFRINIAAISHQNNEVTWWPKPLQKIEKGDKGLVMRCPWDYEEHNNRRNTLTRPPTSSCWSGLLHCWCGTQEQTPTGPPTEVITMDVNKLGHLWHVEQFKARLNLDEAMWEEWKRRQGVELLAVPREQRSNAQSHAQSQSA